MQLNQHNHNLFVLSAANGIDKQKDLVNHASLIRYINAQGIDFTDCEGSYQGTLEKSLILMNTYKMVVHHYASVFGQECFLRLEPHRGNMYKAFSVSVETGKETEIGYFRSMSPEFIKECKLDFTNTGNTTYTIWHTDTTSMFLLDEEMNAYRDKIKEDEKWTQQQNDF